VFVLEGSFGGFGHGWVVMDCFHGTGSVFYRLWILWASESLEVFALPVLPACLSGRLVRTHVDYLYNSPKTQN
jgi:hypothetical protein